MVLRIVLFLSVQMPLGALLWSENALLLSLLAHTGTLKSQYNLVHALDDNDHSRGKI
jgi:hypothetical protein